MNTFKTKALLVALVAFFMMASFVEANSPRSIYRRSTDDMEDEPEEEEPPMKPARGSSKSNSNNNNKGSSSNMLDSRRPETIEDRSPVSIGSQKLPVPPNAMAGDASQVMSMKPMRPEEFFDKLKAGWLDFVEKSKQAPLAFDMTKGFNGSDFFEGMNKFMKNQAEAMQKFGQSMGFPQMPNSETFRIEAKKSVEGVLDPMLEAYNRFERLANVDRCTVRFFCKVGHFFSVIFGPQTDDSKLLSRDNFLKSECFKAYLMGLAGKDCDEFLPACKPNVAMM